MTTTDTQRLRGFIEAKGWGQRETERRAELPKSTLTHYFSGKTKALALETWRKLAAALEVPLAKLLGEEELEAHGVRLLSLEQLEPDLANPRKHFSESDLQGLAESIRRHGILQNLVARPHPERAETWQIIAGERRYIAIGALVEDGRWDMTEANIPVLILKRDEAETRALALLENVQRVQLSPIEEGEAYADLMALDPERWTTAAIAETVGKSQRYVQQRASIGTGLCDEAKDALAAGEITIEQARSMATQEADIQRDTLAELPPEEEPEEEESGPIEEAGSGTDSLGNLIPPAPPPAQSAEPPAGAPLLYQTVSDRPTTQPSSPSTSPDSMFPPEDEDTPIASVAVLRDRIAYKVAHNAEMAFVFWLWGQMKTEKGLTLPWSDEVYDWPLVSSDRYYVGSVHKGETSWCREVPGPVQQKELEKLLQKPTTSLLRLFSVGFACNHPWPDDQEELAIIARCIGVPTRAPVTELPLESEEDSQ